MAQLFSNNAITLLSEGILATDTQLRVFNGTGSQFPVISNPNDYFLVTLENRGNTRKEIVKVIQRSGDEFTVVRAQEGTIPYEWTQNTIVDLRETAGTFKKLQEVVNADFTLTVGSDGFLRITTSEVFSPKSTKLYVGGLRQSLDKDYMEEFSNRIKMKYIINNNDINNGLNIVLDFYKN